MKNTEIAQLLSDKPYVIDEMFSPSEEFHAIFTFVRTFTGVLAHVIDCNETKTKRDKSRLGS